MITTGAALESAAWVSIGRAFTFVGVTMIIDQSPWEHHITTAALLLLIALVLAGSVLMSLQRKVRDGTIHLVVDTDDEVAAAGETLPPPDER